MNKKIKVIELLNKIYADLDVPEKVKYADKKYEYSKATQDYKSEDGEWLFQRMHTFFGRWIEREVEILEDEDEIDIQDIENVNLFDNGQNFNDMPIIIKSYDDNFTNINNTINKLVQSVKQLDKKINKEE